MLWMSQGGTYHTFMLSHDIKKIQKIDKSKVTSQQSKKVQTNMISKGKASSSKLPKSQELNSHFKFHFVQEKDHIPTRIFYNYCCKIGHISLDCNFRKKNNKNVAWVPKVIF
jgi:exopolysaccharide biosynthesis protein